MRAAGDANAVELATLITFGPRVIEKHGITPGHWTRGREFRHDTWPDGRRIAATHVCYRLSADDLLASTTESALKVEELVTTILQSADGGTHG